MSRFVAFAAALSLLVLGGLVGALGTHLYYSQRRPVAEPPALLRGQAIHRLERHLDLTPEQSDELVAILRQAREDGEALRSDVQPRLRRILADALAEINEMLTPEQRRRFREVRRRWGYAAMGGFGDRGPDSPGWRSRRGERPDGSQLRRPQRRRTDGERPPPAEPPDDDSRSDQGDR